MWRSHITPVTRQTDGPIAIVLCCGVCQELLLVVVVATFGSLLHTKTLQAGNLNFLCQLELGTSATKSEKIPVHYFSEAKIFLMDKRETAELRNHFLLCEQNLLTSERASEYSVVVVNIVAACYTLTTSKISERRQAPRPVVHWINVTLKLLLSWLRRGLSHTSWLVGWGPTTG